jgi:putative spermidine/putrescine transport system permease protein
MKLTRGAALLLIPAGLVLGLLLFVPLANVVDESFKLYVPGRIGSAKDAPYTLANYIELFLPVYFFYFLDTYRLGLIACGVALFVAYPMAYYVARQPPGTKRKITVGFLIAMMFLSALVRVYSIELTFGPVGFLRQISNLIGVAPNSRTILEILVIAGLAHFIIPISALVLVGTLQNINPRLAEAAQALGAPRWKAHLTITIPLSARGILSAFLICYTLSISAFVVPMILGKGKLLFISNLIYSRFSEVANYPSGSAISLIMLVVSLLIIYIVSRVASARWGTV